MAVNEAPSGAARSRCVIVNYRSPWEMLERCLESLSEDIAGAPCAVTLVDNASGDGVIARVRSTFPAAGIVEMEHNAGFAAAVNRGLAGAAERYVLLLNTDAVLAPGALARMEAALDAAPPDVAGVAPKMMSSSHEGIIDAIGTVMPPTGASFNRGIGQCDLGQYDRVEDVAGVCFGAALLRRKLFEPDEVGLLYEDYFLYFEDSDWCMRAASQGYRFLTAPEAVVTHMHSGVTRHESLDFKYGLIELNTLKIVTRTFESRLLAGRIVLARCARLLARTLIRRRFIGPNLKTLAAYTASLPRLLRERRELMRRRISSDRKVFRLAEGEDAYFDTVAYRPGRPVDSLIASYARLLERERDPRYGNMLAALYGLRQKAGAPEKAGVGPQVKEMFAAEPGCVRELLRTAEERIQAGPG